MRWDLYLVAESAALRIRPKTAVHLLKTLITDGRIKNVSDEEDPEGVEDDEHVIFRGEPADYAHSIFYDGPKMGLGAAFDRFELDIFSEPRFVPGTEEDEGAEKYWFWLRMTDAQFNFTSTNFAERLTDALRMTVRAVPRPMESD